MAQNRTENASLIHYFIWENKQKKYRDKVQVQEGWKAIKAGANCSKRTAFNHTFSNETAANCLFNF